MRRTFNSSERVALYLDSGGKCSECGAVLQPGWHGDHIMPYAHGGVTDVINGQALCPACNLRKGDRMTVQRRPWKLELRNWQQEAFSRIVSAGNKQRDFMCVATPGAGKTVFALRVAHYRLTTEAVERVVVVCPTEYLKEQWGIAATAAGLNLDYKWTNGNGVEVSDFDGVAVTYQAVARAPQLYRMNCRRSTLVIFDEIHHAGDNLSWGSALLQAFNQATYRLAISGTPFRTDNNAIPFVRYDKDGRSMSDYAYTYGDALRDDVCRQVLFPTYEGTVEWLSNSGEYVSASLGDDLGNDQQVSERLRVALSPTGKWLIEVIKEADDKLTLLRQQHADAGGLIIAIDQGHAYAIAKEMSERLHITATVVVSDDPDASTNIKRFDKSKDRWIIAVKMVSEGVDIPRLRVLVYATNVITELFFRQAVGRIVRRIRDLEDETAYVYIPADERLKRFAHEIKQERDHELHEELSAKDIEHTGSYSGQLSIYDGSAYDSELKEVILDNTAFQKNELDEARDLIQSTNAPGYYDPAIIAMMLRKARISTLPPVETPKQSNVQRREPSLTEQKEKERRKIRKAVAIIHAKKPGLEYSEIYMRLTENDGKRQDQATLEELQARAKYLGDWLERIDAN